MKNYLTRIIFFISFIMTLKSVKAQNVYPKEVLHALNQTKTNKIELLKALEYCYKTNDSIKIKAINFLIENMPIHYSANYYWANEKKERLNFNELQYKDFNAIVDGIEQLKKQHGKIQPIPFYY